LQRSRKSRPREGAFDEYNNCYYCSWLAPVIIYTLVSSVCTNIIFVTRFAARQISTRLICLSRLQPLSSGRHVHHPSSLCKLRFGTYSNKPSLPPFIHNNKDNRRHCDTSHHSLSQRSQQYKLRHAYEHAYRSHWRGLWQQDPPHIHRCQRHYLDSWSCHSNLPYDICSISRIRGRACADHRWTKVRRPGRRKSCLTTRCYRSRLVHLPIPPSHHSRTDTDTNSVVRVFRGAGTCIVAILRTTLGRLLRFGLFPAGFH
jgi:hypothetical protein